MARLTSKERHNDAHLSALNSEGTAKMPTTHNKSRIRWLPAAIILALTVLAVILIWSLEAAHRQSQVFYTVLLLILSFLLMLVWLLFLSRLRWQIRLLAFGAIVLTLFLSVYSLSHKGIQWGLSTATGMALD